MLELLVSFLLLCGISFQQTETGQVRIDGDGSIAIEKTRSSEPFDKLGGDPALNAVIVTDGIDPNK